MKFTLRTLLLLLCGTAALFNGIIRAQAIDEITLLQDSRTVAGGRLAGLLKSADSQVRARAEIALANIQDPASLASLRPLLDDSVPVVRRNCAFAIGQIGDGAFAPLLLNRLRVERDNGCLTSLLETLGRIGIREALRTMVVEADSLPAGVRCEVALSIARFALRKVKDSAATEFVARGLGDPRSEPWASYAFMRIADSSALARHLARVKDGLSNPSAEVRMWSATALGLSSESSVIRLLIDRAAKDPDWRVRVNCIRALQANPGEESLAALVNLCRDENEHVALTAYSAINTVAGKMRGEKLASTSISLFEDVGRFSWRRKAAAAELLAGCLGKKAYPRLRSSVDTNSLLRADIIRAIGETKSSLALPFLEQELHREAAPSVTAAVDAYCSIAEGGDTAMQAKFLRTITPLLFRPGISIASAVLSAFEDTSISRELRRRYAGAMIPYLTSHADPKFDDVSVELAGVLGDLRIREALPALQEAASEGDARLSTAAELALRLLTGSAKEPSPHSPRPVKTSYSLQDTALLSRYHSALLRTTEGAIRIAFRSDAAPFSVLNFILLVRKHFYDHSIFHRVVPNFVIQGGDPEGTGYGGPGYAVRTEVDPTAWFTAGAVGMASSGKDTEGSQFFITHCPTPHLDGRYTVFGYTSDLDVVDRIQRGDEILAVELEE
ncbi:MAG TPA: peptidylprolyl isomerase [Bacteroidota bacterium]|nr:peptidylprolyl isomerase [Bacteroidota bacterium]